MAQEVVNGDFVEVKIYTFLDNQLGENVLYGMMQASVGPQDAATIAIDVRNWFRTKYTDLMANDAVFLGISLRTWGIAVGYPDFATIWSKQDPWQAGTAGAVPCPKQASGIVSKYTPYGGRRGQGRSYVPFPATDSVEADGNPTAAYLADLTTLGNAMVGPDPVGGGNYDIQWGLMKWRQPNTFLALVNSIPRDRFATQRRRGDYGRVNAIPAPLA